MTLKLTASRLDHAGGCSRNGRFFPLPEVRCYAVNDLVERGLRAEAGERLEFIDAGDAPHHILKTRLVGLVVRNKFDGRRAVRAELDQLRERFDGDLFGVPDIYDLA